MMTEVNLLTSACR